MRKAHDTPQTSEKVKNYISGQSGIISKLFGVFKDQCGFLKLFVDLWNVMHLSIREKTDLQCMSFIT